MQTKLSRYATGLMEASWLAALILVPAFFNVFSSRIFEPDKLTLLRTIALVILAAWLVKLIDEGGFKWTRLPGEGPAWRSLLRVPLVAPVLGLAIVYVISTIFSISPRASLWGSYQRLQGTYTTFSYLVIFAAVSANLRNRAQLERLITTVILTSLPISLYGILQRYKIDPVPWGGDVTQRIASNMGNSIFLAAYLIMVNPLTMLRIFESFRSILKEHNGLGPHVVRATAYVFIAALQLIAMYFTGSRGPWLGWLAGSFFLFVVLSLVWRKRWLTVSVVAGAALIAIFLLALNLPSGPLKGLQSLPGVGRLGELLDSESRTGRVRTLIWQGAAELFLPHKPLAFPDGHTDPFNFLRPLIGYGPESMYVAYSPFYPPELTQVEKRNASPDRSHNETWDSLVITGGLGLIAYLALFGSVVYFALKWLGLIITNRQRNLFLGLTLGGGVTSAIVFVAWKGAGYFGVGLPFGVIIGLLAYLTIVALFGHYETPKTEGERIRALTLISLLAVVVAHFVEINFGIAIAVTRTYFFTFSALLLLVGYVLPLHGEYKVSSTSLPPSEPQGQVEASHNDRAGKFEPSRRKKRQGSRVKARAAARGRPEWLSLALISSFVLALLLVTLGYNFISPPSGNPSAFAIVWSSLVRLRGSQSPISYGMLAMVLTTWLVGAVLLPSEEVRGTDTTHWWKIIAYTLGVSLLIALLFWLWHASALEKMVNITAHSMDDVNAQLSRFEGLLTRYYIYIFLLIFVGGIFFVRESFSRVPVTARVGGIVAPISLIVVFVLASYTNLRIIQADIAFKQADPYVKQDAWEVAINIYNRANRLAPTEDYYYLFLGRAYIEDAQSLTDQAQRETLITTAKQDLEKAQSLNPLNIDHTANLARLYSLWSVYSTDDKLRAERAQMSSDYFAQAVVISPHNAKLWDEWGLLYLNNLKEPAEALKRYTHSLEIDPYYDWTYSLMGDYTSRLAQNAASDQEKQQIWQKAIGYYQKALEEVSPSDPTSKYNYLVSLSNIYILMKDYQSAANIIEEALTVRPNATDSWRLLESLTRLYYQLGDIPKATQYATQALAAAPQTEKQRLQGVLTTLQTQPSQQP